MRSKWSQMRKSGLPLRARNRASMRSDEGQGDDSAHSPAVQCKHPLWSGREQMTIAQRWFWQVRHSSRLMGMLPLMDSAISAQDLEKIQG